MAASMDNGRQFEKSELEQRTQKVRLRPRQRRDWQKQPPRQEVMPIPSQPPERRLRHKLRLRVSEHQRRSHLSHRDREALRRRAARKMVSPHVAAPMPRRSKPVPPKQIPPRPTKSPSATPTPTHLRQLRENKRLSETQYIRRSQSATQVPSASNQVRTTDARNFRQGIGSQSSPSRNRISRHPQKRPLGPLVYITRLLILGIGIGAIVGTLLSALDPATQASVKANDAAKTQIQPSPSRRVPAPLALTQEILPLKTQIQTLVAQNPKLQPGVFILDPDSGAYIDWNSDSSFASASTIKLPILVAFFQDVDAGKMRLDELLTLKPGMIADGSGDLQYKQPGTQYTALEVVTKMITISDNSATNMLVERLGGAEALNQRFRSWGLTATAIRNRLPDVEGTNTTSPKELANLMSIVNQGQLISLRSRDRILDIMQRTETNTLLPKGLGEGAMIAHKTGNIGSVIADAGLVDMPTGKRYIVSVMVKRPFNDTSAEELIRQISRLAYSYFNQPRITPSTNSMPPGSTSTVS